MTAADRRLAALAAIFAPERARTLLARLDVPSGPDLARAAEALARAPRRERLVALGAAIAAPARGDAFRTLLRGERERLAAALVAAADPTVVRDGAGPPARSPLLARLCVERLVPPG